jgi:hypothetical protein
MTRLPRFCTLFVALSILCLGLAGCILSQPGKPDISVALPKPPDYYRACFAALTKEPAGTLTRERVVTLIAQLRQSEKRKSQCGKDLLAWYSAVQVAYAKKGVVP